MSYATVLAGLHERLAAVSGTAASLTIDPAGADNALLWTAAARAFKGNQISVEYADPGASDSAMALTVEGREIIVSLATDGAGAITTVADDIAAAVLLDGDVSTLVTVADVAPDDGTGVVTAMARAYLTGGISDLVDILDYAPTAVHDTPLVYSLLDNVQRRTSAQIVTKQYRILHRLVVRWQDNEQAEQEIIPFVDSVPEAVADDPQLGGRLTSGYAEIKECDAGWVTIAGVEYRMLDFYATVVEK